MSNVNIKNELNLKVCKSCKRLSCYGYTKSKKVYEKCEYFLLYKKSFSDGYHFGVKGIQESNKFGIELQNLIDNRISDLMADNND